MNKVFVFLFFLVTNSAIAQISIKDAFPNGVGLVDLGLSVKWASCNIGASSPEDIGEYFSWTKQLNYSVGNFRLPNRNEVDELIEKCSWSYTKNNGIKGYKVVGPNGNSIFLPLGGQNINGYFGSQSKPKIRLKGKKGLYWISQYEDRNTHYFLTIGESRFVDCDWLPFSVIAIPIRLVSK